MEHRLTIVVPAEAVTAEDARDDPRWDELYEFACERFGADVLASLSCNVR